MEVLQFLHLGGNVRVPLSDIVLMLDLDANTRRNRRSNMELIKAYEEKGLFESVEPSTKKSDSLEKFSHTMQSLILTEKRLYYSPVSITVLWERYLKIKREIEKNSENK